jgi:uncharacterized protein
MCRAGTSWDGKRCAAVPQCTGGKIRRDGGCFCPDGTSWDGSRCIEPPPPFRPSFDCRTAKDSIEKTICRSSTLATLDRELWQAFNDLLSRSSRSVQDALKFQQINWALSRWKCVDNEQCMIALYRARIETLKRESVGKQRTFISSGRGYVGGMIEELRVYAHNVPLNLPEEQVRKARAEAEAQFRKRLSLAGIQQDEFIDPRDYDFILGVATTSKLIDDMSMVAGDSARQAGDAPRVLWDELTGGRGTPVMQSQYELLRGRSFEVLDCHSNGAMICLAALANGDIRAGRVRLLGPQITRKALQQWQTLLRSGDIQRLEIYLSDRDPVPLMSYVVSAWDDFPAVMGGSLPVLVEVAAPSASVIRLSCDTQGRFKYSLSCHAMTNYQKDR